MPFSHANVSMIPEKPFNRFSREIIIRPSAPRLLLGRSKTTSVRSTPTLRNRRGDPFLWETYKFRFDR